MNELISGYVRPAITVAFTAAFIYGFMVDVIGSDVFTSTATMVIVYWFKARDEEKKS